jgi:hypothetical protein
MDRHLAFIQPRDFLFVDVNAYHVVASLGEASSGNQSDIPGTKYGDFH